MFNNFVEGDYHVKFLLILPVLSPITLNAQAPRVLQRPPAEFCTSAALLPTEPRCPSSGFASRFDVLQGFSAIPGCCLFPGLGTSAIPQYICSFSVFHFCTVSEISQASSCSPLSGLHNGVICVSVLLVGILDVSSRRLLQTATLSTFLHKSPGAPVHIWA